VEIDGKNHCPRLPRRVAEILLRITAVTVPVEDPSRYLKVVMILGRLRSNVVPPARTFPTKRCHTLIRERPCLTTNGSENIVLQEIDGSTTISMLAEDRLDSSMTLTLSQRGRRV